MPLVPQFYMASNKENVKKALEKGLFKYPGICYIENGQTFAIMDIDNNIHYVLGDEQITDIKYENNNLIFYSGDKEKYNFNIQISEENSQLIIDKILEIIDIDYAKNEYVENLINENKNNIMEYINNLSYDNLSNIPIINKTGTLEEPIVILNLNDGTYKIKGQFIIGGNHTTIQSTYNEVIFFVLHDQESLNTYITSLYSNSIKLYIINSDGSYTTDSYITESYINSKNYATFDEVESYVKNAVIETTTQVIDETLDEKLNIALENYLTEINSDNIQDLFITQ